MFRTVSALALTLMLIAGPARAETFSITGYQAPPLIEVLVTGDLPKVMRSGDEAKQLFLAYSMGFALLMSSKWPDAWPQELSNKVMSKSQVLVIAGTKEAGDLLMSGTKDAEIFVARNARDSIAARRVIVVLRALAST